MALTKKTLYSLLAVLFFFAPLLASPVASQTEPSPAIWKLSDHDSDIWIFGTVHILKPSLKWRSEKINQAFFAADTVYFEAPANQEAMQPLIMKYGINKGEPLSAQMTANGRANMKRALTALGMPLSTIQQLEPLRPWLAGLSLAAFQIQAQGGDPNAGVERILQAEANRLGKTLQYLESDEEQIQFLSGLSQKAQIYFLEDGLRAVIEEPELLNELVDGWVQGDMNAIDAAMLQSLQGQQELYAALLVNRNKKWAAQIKDILAGSGTSFIAVGAAHLAGGNSVQYYLGDYGLVPVRQ